MTRLLLACLATVTLSAAQAWAHDREQAAAGVGTAPLRGGVEGIRRALGDRTPMPPAMAVAELTRRFHGGTDLATDRDPAFSRFRAWLRECATTAACEASVLPPDPVPLPGSPAFWTRSGLVIPPGPDALILALLESRGAALLYTALLSMEPATRGWFLDRPEFLRTLSESDRGALVIAAPHLGLAGGRFVLPGGPAASRAWADLIGMPPDAEPAFVETLVRRQSGRVVYALEVVATLTSTQQAVALGLADSIGVQTARAFVAALGEAVGSWQPGERPFWRPSPDPAFLIAQIGVTADGRLVMPGGRRFWEFTLGDDELTPSAAQAAAAWKDTDPLTPYWLIARLASLPADDQLLRYQQFLFAARLPADAGADPGAVATAIRGYARFPPLFRTLERLGIADAARLAAMARQAATLTRSGEDWRGRAALVEWQATLALLDRMERTGALSAAMRDATIVSLATPSSSTAGAPWRPWLSALCPEGCDGADASTRSVERAIISRLAASPLAADRRVEWEATAYRLDFAAAERDRLAKVRGRDNRPLVDTAHALTRLAAATQARQADELLRDLSALTAAAGVDRPIEPDDEFGRRAHESATRARRLLVAARGQSVPENVGAALRDLADALAAAGLIELAYAANMGWAEDLPLTAAAASRRHVLIRPQGADRDRRWAAPAINADRRFPWHLSGSLLGLDVALAPVAMRRLSLRPLPASPLLNTGDRTALVATAAVLNPHGFTDQGQRDLEMAVSRALAAVNALEDGAGARRIAGQARLSTLRTAVFEWRVASDRQRLAEFFTMTELVRIGMAGQPVPETLRDWGNYEVALTGRMTAGTLPELAVERYAGRSRRLLASAVPDLQLALVLRLAEMELPAALVPALMASASFDVVNTAPSRHTDDWLAVVSRVREIDALAVERYLGLLTTGGPLRVVATAGAR
jgi:hypothetical protein